MRGNRLTAHPFQVVRLDDLPVFRFGVIPGAFFMVFRTLTTSLVFGTDSNPDTYMLS